MLGFHELATVGSKPSGCRQTCAFYAPAVLCALILAVVLAGVIVRSNADGMKIWKGCGLDPVSVGRSESVGVNETQPRYAHPFIPLLSMCIMSLGSHDRNTDTPIREQVHSEADIGWKEYHNNRRPRETFVSVEQRPLRLG